MVRARVPGAALPKQEELQALHSLEALHWPAVKPLSSPISAATLQKGGVPQVVPVRRHCLLQALARPVLGQSCPQAVVVHQAPVAARRVGVEVEVVAVPHVGVAEVLRPLLQTAFSCHRTTKQFAAEAVVVAAAAANVVAAAAVVVAGVATLAPSTVVVVGEVVAEEPGCSTP